MTHYGGITVKIANRNARVHVQNLEEFQGNNLYAGWRDEKWYIVFSYGTHWPMFAFDRETKTWFENISRYSCTTSKHRTQAHPHIETVGLPVEALKELLRR